jgi:hypothetical protein
MNENEGLMISGGYSNCPAKPDRSQRPVRFRYNRKFYDT